MAEIIGEFYSKEEAEAKYGAVLSSSTISIDELKEIMSKTENEVMLRENDGSVEILNSQRKPLSSLKSEITKEVVFTRFSIQLVEELIRKSNKKIITVEQRKEVISLTSGDLVLQGGLPCPPFCH